MVPLQQHETPLSAGGALTAKILSTSGRSHYELAIELPVLLSVFNHSGIFPPTLATQPLVLLFLRLPPTLSPRGFRSLRCPGVPAGRSAQKVRAGS